MQERERERENVGSKGRRVAVEVGIVHAMGVSENSQSG